MSKNRKKTRRRKGPPPNAAAPKVHVKVALADMDLRNAGRLIKPALLYADRVTVYSPAASMVKSVAAFADISEPHTQIAAMMSVIDEVPELRSQLALAPDTSIR